MEQTALLRKYPQLAADPQFMALYERLSQLAHQGAFGELIPQNAPKGYQTETAQIVPQLTARARQLGLPADREIWANGADYNIHERRNDALKGIALAGGLLAGGAALGGAFGGGSAAAGSGATLGGGSSSVAATVPAGVGTGSGTAATVAGVGGTAGAAAPFGVPAATAGGRSIPWGQIISTGGGLLQNYLGGRANSQAIASQQAANDKATAINQQAAQQARQDVAATSAQQGALYSPYLNLGAGAAGTLASRMGLPSLPAPGSSPAAAPSMPSAQMSTSSQLTPVNPGNAQGIVNQPLGQPLSNSAPQGRTLADLAAPAVAQQQTQSGYVQMQNPADGSVQRVPVNAVPYFKAKGAIVMQGAA